MGVPQRWSRLLFVATLALLLCTVPLSVSASGNRADKKNSGVSIEFYDPNDKPDYQGSATPDKKKEFGSDNEPGVDFGSVLELPVGIPQTSGNVSMIKDNNSLGQLPKTGGGALPGYLLLAAGCGMILVYGISQSRRRNLTHG